MVLYIYISLSEKGKSLEILIWRRCEYKHGYKLEIEIEIKI